MFHALLSGLEGRTGGEAGMSLADRETWPDLRVTLHLLPWTWRLKPRIYVDDVDGAIGGHASLTWLFLVVEWWGNKPLFREADALTKEANDG